MTYCYLLISGSRTYIGATYDPDHRLRQHNGELVGGAKATSGHKWERVMLISGFPDWRSTLQFEWAWKYFSRKTRIKGLPGRIQGLLNLLQSDRATKKAVPFKEWGSEVKVQPERAWYERVEKIEAWSRLLAVRGSPFRVSIPSSDPLEPISFRMSSSKTSSAASSADIAALTKAIQALVEQQATNNKVVTALLERMSKTTSSAPAPKVVEDAPTKGKRGRKPKAEPKEKPAPPDAEEGTIRIGSATEGEYKEFNSFFKAPFKVDGKEYLSLANYFNSQKFVGTDDDFAEDIRTQKNPALTRAKASSVKEHAPIENWDTEKTAIMRRGLLAKFSANSALRAKLLATGEAPLESTIDEEMRVKGFWSIGEDGAGENQMGQLLMSVRTELSAGAPKAQAKPKAASKPAAPAPKGKAPAPKEEEADSDSDSDSDDEGAPKPKSKTAPAAKATTKPAPKPAAPAPKAAEDSDSEEDEDSDSDEDDE